MKQSFTAFCIMLLIPLCLSGCGQEREGMGDETAVINPVQSSSLDELNRETRCCLALPEEEFLEVAVTRFALTPVLYQVDFRYKDGQVGCFRFQQDTGEKDISGMYFQWDETIVKEDPAFEVRLAQDGQGICLWQQGGFVCSLSMEKDACWETLAEMRLGVTRALET